MDSCTYVDGKEFAPVGFQVVPNAVGSSFQGSRPDDEDKDDKVRHQGGHPDGLQEERAI